MQLLKAVEGYMIAALAEGYSPLTLNPYRSALNTMIEFLGDREIKTITTDDLRNFMAYLVTDYKPERRNNPVNQEKLSKASHHRYWKAMRSFFRWADLDLKVGRPDKLIRMPEWENKEIIPFTEEDIRLLIIGCEFAHVKPGNRI